MPHLLLQLENAVHQSLASRRATGNVDIHRHNPIAPSGNTVAVMIISSSVCTRTHTDHPSRFRHLIVDLAESGGHLVRKCSGDYHNV